MSDTKQDVLDMLRELTTLTQLDEGDAQSFRVRAYENATRAIAEQANDLGRLSAKELQKIDGVGKSIADKVLELLSTGRVEKLESLRRSYPRSLLSLLRIQGLGPKAVKRLKNELGVLGIDDLRRVLAEKKLRDLKGFGAKSETKLIEALARVEAQGSLDRWPIAVALPHAERIVLELRQLSAVSHVQYCGSLRRFQETAGDIDIVAVASDAISVMAAFTRLPMVERVLGHGDAKASVVTLRGLQVDLRVVKPDQLGAALIYFTGSKAHNIKLRQRALSRGWTLNEYGLVDQGSGRVVASATEPEVYAALGLCYVPPHLREDNGEIEAAEAGRLPRPLTQIHGDFHVHTSVSGDGRSTLEQMVTAARERGYSTLAITDHAEGTLSGVGRDALLAQRDRIAALQRELGGGLRLLHGVELNLGPEGELDYDAEFRRSFDWCVASVHSHFELDAAAQTRRLTRAMREPEVRLIGHPAARVIGGRPPIAFDTAEVLRVAAETGTLLEVNGALPRLDCSVDVLRQARGTGARFLLTSDAHHTTELSLMDYAVTNAERGWLEPSQVVNAWPAAELRRWVATPKSV